jgi:hypothetical protein
LGTTSPFSHHRGLTNNNQLSIQCQWEAWSLSLWNRHPTTSPKKALYISPFVAFLCEKKKGESIFLRSNLYFRIVEADSWKKKRTRLFAAKLPLFFILSPLPPHDDRRDRTTESVDQRREWHTC